MLKGSGKIARGVLQCRALVNEFSPDAVVGFGSFYTLPVLVAAKLQKIPIVLHEQNSIPGKVNRLFSPYARVTGLTFPESASHLKGPTRLVDFPLRSCGEDDPWRYFGLEPGRKTLLIFGGSQGAKRLNALFLEAVKELDDVQVLHFGVETTLYQELGIPHVVKPFEPKMHLALAIADLAITRAGAGTIAELNHTKTPAILVPFPYATDNHQEKNARAFVGGEVYIEKELSAETLVHAIRTFPFAEKRARLEQQKTTNPTLSSLIEEITNG